MRKFLKRILGTTTHPVEDILKESSPLPSRLKKAMSIYLQELGAERGCILLELPESPPQVIYAGPPELEKQFPFSRTVVDAVLDEGRGFYCYDSHEEFEADSESLNSQGSRSFVCTPIVEGDVHYGVLYLDNPTTRGLFSQDSLADLEEFTRLITTNL
jgi:GAF domain-containing protein